MNEISPPLTMEELKSQFDRIEATSKNVQEQIRDCAEIMRRQNQMLDIAVGLFEALADDQDIHVSARRRILFALQQLKGLAKLS